MAEKLTKNAKKRAARRAFHADPLAEYGALPYAFHVIEYRDGQRRKLTFASLTSYKEYRERFYKSGTVGQLVLVSDLESLDDSKGKAFRSKVINKGADTSKAKPKRLDNTSRLVNEYGESTGTRATGKRFQKNGFKTTSHDANQSVERDRLRLSEEQVRPRASYDPKALERVRLKHTRTI